MFRTGGDEFIALLSVDEEQLIRIKQEIEELTGAWRGKADQTLTISCGYVALKENPDMGIRQMAVLADSRMYEEKDAFYKRTGLERRKNKY